MSGRFSLTARSRVPGVTQVARSWLAASVVTRRLLIALGLSLFAHLVLLLLPYIEGGGSGESAASAGGSRLRYRIHATLAPDPGAGPIDAARGNAMAAQSMDTQSADTPSADAPGSTGQTGAAGPGGLFAIAPLAYYTTDQLSKRPQPLQQALPDEENLRLLAASGKVVLRLWITDQGGVAEVAIERSDLPAEFSQAIAAAFRGARFAAGERSGLPVGSIIRIEVNYADERRSAP